jgi:hypothetical protein
VILPGLGLLLGGEFGQAEDLADLLGVLPGELEGDLEARQVEEFLDPHEVGGREQIEEHVTTPEVGIGHELLVPSLIHDLRRAFPWATSNMNGRQKDGITIESNDKMSRCS